MQPKWKHLQAFIVSHIHTHSLSLSISLFQSRLFGISITLTTFASNHIFAFHQYIFCYYIRRIKSNQIKSSENVSVCVYIRVFIGFNRMQTCGFIIMTRIIYAREHTHCEHGHDAMLVKMSIMWVRKSSINAKSMQNYTYEDN